MILDTRERQLHDEPLSCGTQPAYIRLINRRFAACFAISALFKHGFDLIKTKTTVYLTGQYISGVCAAERHPFNLRRSRTPLAGIQRRMLWSANRRQESMGQKLKPPSVVISVDIDTKVKIQ